MNPPASPRPWKRKLLDRVLDSWFSGVDVTEIAHGSGVREWEIELRIYRLMLDSGSYASRYRPIRRISRKGKPFHFRELDLLEAHRFRGVSTEVTARVLQRDPKEIVQKVGRSHVPPSRELVPAWDLIWALRYCFEKYGSRVVPDEEYDLMVREEIEFGPDGEENWKRIRASDYPERIRSLALYLVLRQEGK